MESLVGEMSAMKNLNLLSRRAFLWGMGVGGAAPVFARLATPSSDRIGVLRREIVNSPVSVALHRARVFTRVFQENED